MLIYTKSDTKLVIPCGLGPLVCEGGGGSCELQAKTVDPSTVSQTVTPDASYDGLSQVTVNAVDASIDANIEPGNIKSGVTILGVEGDYEGEWDWVVQAKRHEIDDVTDKSLEELAQLEWGACGILSGTEITELPEIDFGDPIATHGLAYSLAGTSISDVEIPATTNALNAHSCFEGMFFECNDLEHVSFSDFDVTPYTDGEMSEHFERAFMNAGGNVSPVIEWDDPEDHSQGGVMSPGLLIEFPNLTYANSNMFNEAFRGIKGADASFGILGVEFPVLEKIGGTYTPSNNEAKSGVKALPSNNGVKCFYNAFHSSRLYNGSGGQIDEFDMELGTMHNIFPALTEIYGNAVFAHAFSRSNLYNFGFPNELTLYLSGESETEGMFECVCRDCKKLQSISLSATYAPGTEDRNTKVWRDAFDGCDDLTAAYISDTLVAYPDSRNILESAPNIEYIELNTLPDFDYSINTYEGHDMYFTWQPGLNINAIANILDFAWNEFADAEYEPHEIWFHENTVLENQPGYDPEDPESMSFVNSIMEFKANLESCGWTIHNLYKYEADILPDLWEYSDYLRVYHNPAQLDPEGVWCDTGVKPFENTTYFGVAFSAPNTGECFVFGCDNGGEWGVDERIFGVYIDNDDMYIGLGHSLADCLLVNVSDIDFTQCVNIEANLVEVDTDVYEWEVNINDEIFSLDPGDLSDMNNITLFSRYNSNDDEYDMMAPSGTVYLWGSVGSMTEDSEETYYFDPARLMERMDNGQVYSIGVDGTRLGIAYDNPVAGQNTVRLVGITPVGYDIVYSDKYALDLGGTYSMDGTDRQMLPNVFEGAVPAFVEADSPV